MTTKPSFSRRVFNANAQQAVTLLNVSYDPTRELYAEFNTAFAKHWKARTGAAFDQIYATK